MNAKALRKMIVVAVVLLGVCTGGAYADRVALQDVLRKPLDVELSDVTISQALEQIGVKAGVQFVLSDEAIWKLPYGEATRLSVTLKGPLAESMTEMLNAFFMRYAVGEEEVTIYPRRELEHILGRPTTEQLGLLKKMYTMVFAVRGSDPGAVLKGMISKALGQPVVILPLERYSDLSEVLRVLGEGLADDQPLPEMALAQMLNSLGDQWYIAGPDFAGGVVEIRVVDELGFQVAKLDQVVDISFKDEIAEEVIRRLAIWTGLELVVDKQDPSWLDEPISVAMQNIKLSQALISTVASVDGTAYIDYGSGQIRVKGPLHSKAPRSVAAKTPARGGRMLDELYVGKISIPMDGGKYYIEFMLRESDLTDELKRLRAERIKEILSSVSDSKDRPEEEK